MERIHPLKAFREVQNPPLSRHDLAKLLGVDRVTVARWETGARRIDENRLPAIAKVTGISPSLLRPDLAQLISGADP